MNPFSELSTSVTPLLVLCYAAAVLITAIIGLVNIAVLHKHAERPSIARGITLVFIIFFLIICILSSITILQSLSNTNA